MTTTNTSLSQVLIRTLTKCIAAGELSEMHLTSEHFDDHEIEVGESFCIFINGHYYETVNAGTGGSFGFDVETVAEISAVDFEISKVSAVVFHHGIDEVELSAEEVEQISNLLKKNLTVILES